MPIQNWATRDLLDALMTKVSKKTFKTVKDLDVIEERLQKITAILRGRRNALASINRLPTELLENIFELVQLHLHIFIPSPPTASGYDHGYRGWLVLLAVCRHWRGIAATSGVLWSSVDTSFMPQRFLKRSKDSLLSVYCGIRRRPAPKAELQLIQPHLHRVRELHLDVSKWVNSTAELMILLSVPTPHLRSLTLETAGPTTGGPALPPLFTGEMPQLRMLTLEYFITWPDGYFRGLTHVCLHHQPQDILRVRTSEFLDFLDASPELEELVLVSAGPTRTETDDVPSPQLGRLVRLSKLREFTWGKVMDLSLVRRLLGYLSVPSTTRMFFWGSTILGHDGDIAKLIPDNLTNLPCFLNIQTWHLRCTPSKELLLGQENYLIAFENQTLYTLDICSEVYLARMAAAYAPILRIVEQLVVRDRIAMTTGLWEDLFYCMPQLQSIDLHPHPAWNASRGILAALYPEADPSARTGLKSLLKPDDVLCPNLKRLSFDVAPGLQGPGFYISMFAKGRKDKGAPLDKLQIRYMQHDDEIVDVHAPPPPPPPPPPLPGATIPQTAVLAPITVAAPPEVVQETGLELEAARLAEASVGSVEYLYSQQDVGPINPRSWPNRAFVWTTMPNHHIFLANAEYLCEPAYETRDVTDGRVCESQS